MPLTAHELSVAVFVRGLSNLKVQLQKAAEHVAASGLSEASLLQARFSGGNEAGAPADVHRFTLAAQAHWAAEGARLAVSQLLGTSGAPDANVAGTFSTLVDHLDATIAALQQTPAAELEAGLSREIELSRPRAAARASGSLFLSAFALPHFFFHLTAAYNILREQGVPLTMGDFLGSWHRPAVG